MTDIQVDMLGLETSHNLGDVIDRPRGWGMYLLQRFHTPMELLQEKTTITAEPGDCILYEPTCPQRYQGRNVGFCDDWMHFFGRDVGKLIRTIKLPVNRVFHPSITAYMTPSMEAIQNELHGRETHWQKRIAGLVMDLLLLLSRHLQGASSLRYTTSEMEHLPQFRTLRRNVQQTPAKPWTIEQMAQEVFLSPSHFSALYRKYFGVSPMEDLLRRRIQEACRLLSNTTMSVSKAAEMSGFANIYYFSRQFHKRVRCAPRDYYRNMTCP